MPSCPPLPRDHSSTSLSLHLAQPGPLPSNQGLIRKRGGDLAGLPGICRPIMHLQAFRDDQRSARGGETTVTVLAELHVDPGGVLLSVGPHKHPFPGIHSAGQLPLSVPGAVAARPALSWQPLLGLSSGNLSLLVAAPSPYLLLLNLHIIISTKPSE